MRFSLKEFAAKCLSMDNRINVFQTVWADDGIKSCPIFTHIAQKIGKYFLYDSCIILNSPKRYQDFLATFVRKFVTQKF